VQDVDYEAIMATKLSILRRFFWSWDGYDTKLEFLLEIFLWDWGYTFTASSSIVARVYFFLPLKLPHWVVRSNVYLNLNAIFDSSYLSVCISDSSPCLLGALDRIGWSLMQHFVFSGIFLKHQITVNGVDFLLFQERRWSYFRSSFSDFDSRLLLLLFVLVK